MQISPCGWYCFEEPSDWQCVSTPHSIQLIFEANQTSIDISSARQDEILDESHINQLQDDFERESGIRAQETSRYTLPRGSECQQCVYALDNRVLCLTWVWWGHYCVRLQLDGPIDTNTESAALGMKHVLQTIEALTVD